jgi:hypothetical protein
MNVYLLMGMTEYFDTSSYDTTVITAHQTFEGAKKYSGVTVWSRVDDKMVETFTGTFDVNGIKYDTLQIVEIEVLP